MRGQTGSLQLVTMVELVLRSAVNKKCLLPGVVAPVWWGGGGGDSNIKMHGCVCWGSENVPILRDALGNKTYPY